MPDSPVISTVALDCDSRPMARNTSCIAGAWPRISGVLGRASRTACASRRLSSSARRISSTAWSTSKGLGRYSKAPPWKAATALSRSEYAVITMTGTAGWRCLTALQQLEAREPGHADVGHQHFRRVARERVERILRG